MALSDQITTRLALADQMRGTKAANEANTKAVLIEPILQALGWDITDPSRVSREYRVYDGTFLDYALLIDGQPRLFVEAKALGEKLDNNQFVSQAVNYANNEGVIWCVLTDGIVYRVFKTNEPVAMQRKLLYEVELDEARSGSASSVAAALQRLNPQAVGSGELDRWGEQFFADQRVRDVLAELGREPPTALTSLLHQRLGQPKLSPELLAESLNRVLAGGRSPAPLTGLPKPKQQGTQKAKSAPGGRTGKDYPIELHTDKKPQLIVDLFEQVDEFARGLSPDVIVGPRKEYVGYYVGKRAFFTMELQKTKVWVYLKLNPDGVQPWDDSRMRDVRSIGHFGLGDTEYNLAAPEHVDAVKHLVQLAYDAL